MASELLPNDLVTNLLAKVSVAEAEALIRPFAVPLAWENLPLRQAAGRISREPILSDRAYPTMDRVCMDGIAIRQECLGKDGGEFRILGTGKAGAPPGTLSDPFGCFEVMTGAPLPIGADTVIPVEEITVQGGTARLVRPEAIRRGQHIQSIGSDSPCGRILVAEGVRLHAAHLAIAASVGMDGIRVNRRPSIRVVSTGDEIVSAGVHPQPWEIRGSNPIALGAMVASLADWEAVRAADRPESLDESIRWGLQASDILVLSGGVSAGKFDLVPDALLRNGVGKLFHKAAIKPGKPIWFGRGERGTPVFGLPGNPVSFMICFRRFVLPLIRAMAGYHASPGPERVRLTAPVSAKPGVTSFQPVAIGTGVDRVPEARPISITGSGDFCGLGLSDGFVEIPPGKETLPEGESVPFHAWEAV